MPLLWCPEMIKSGPGGILLLCLYFAVSFLWKSHFSQNHCSKHCVLSSLWRGCLYPGLLSADWADQSFPHPLQQHLPLCPSWGVQNEFWLLNIVREMILSRLSSRKLKSSENDPHLKELWQTCEVMMRFTSTDKGPHRPLWGCVGLCPQQALGLLLCRVGFKYWITARSL